MYWLTAVGIQRGGKEKLAYDAMSSFISYPYLLSRFTLRMLISRLQSCGKRQIERNSRQSSLAHAILPRCISQSAEACKIW